MCQQKQSKDRREDRYRFSHSTEVQERQEEDDCALEHQLPVRRIGREHAEYLIRSPRDRHGDRQHVVDEQCRSGNDAPTGTEQFRRDHVAAATERELSDDLRVRERDDQHRHGRGDCQSEREVDVIAQRAECFIRSVRRRREAVSSESYPGEQGHERDRMKRARVLRIAWLTVYETSDARCHAEDDDLDATKTAQRTADHPLRSYKEPGTVSVGSAAGIDTVNTEPPPGRGLNSTVPPWASSARRAIESPRPAPCPALDADAR